MPTNTNATTRGMVEGAIAASLATILALLGYYLPPISIIVSLVWFIPIVVVVVRQSLHWGVMTLVVTTFLLMIFTNPIRGLLLVIQMGFVGLLYGYGFKNKWSPGKIIILGGLVVVMATLAAFGLTMVILGVDAVGWHQELLAQADAAIEMYRNLGLIDSAVSEEEMREVMDSFIQFITLVIPGILVTGSLMTALLNFLVVRVILRRLGEEVEPIPPFRQWQLPWYFIWGIIAGLALLLVGDYYGNQLWKTIGINILYIYFPILLLTGLTVLAHFNHHLNIPRWIKIVLVIVLLLNFPFAMILIASIGLFDPLLNYRRLNKGSQE